MIKYAKITTIFNREIFHYQRFTCSSSGNLSTMQNTISEITAWDSSPIETFQANPFIQQLLQLFLQHLPLPFLSSVRCTRASFFFQYIHTSSGAYSDPSLLLVFYQPDKLQFRPHSILPPFSPPKGSFFPNLFLITVTCQYLLILSNKS